MTNVKFSSRPFEGTLSNLVDNLFSELPVLFRNDFNETTAKGFVPVNVKETEKTYRMEVVAPGFEKKDFKVTLDKNLLTISAERETEPDSHRVKEDKERQIRREYSYRSFKRTFTLDEKTDATNIEASYINGVLVLNLPKKVEVKTPATEVTIK
ncbi:MAG: Hsp20/alpha crystallin family protein [Bacteroidota bacterium]